MIKAIFVFAILGLSLFTGSFFTKYYSYKKAKSRTVQLELNNGNRYAKGNVDVNSSELVQVIQSLSVLTDFPLLGVFFMQQKILELSKIDKWQEVINESLYAIQTSANKKSFSIWYHKALAECILGKISDCQQSAKQASFFSSDIYHEGHLTQLFKYVQQAKRQQKLKGKKTIKDQQKQYSQGQQDKKKQKQAKDIQTQSEDYQKNKIKSTQQKNVVSFQESEQFSSQNSQDNFFDAQQELQYL